MSQKHNRETEEIISELAEHRNHPIWTEKIDQTKKQAPGICGTIKKS